MAAQDCWPGQPLISVIVPVYGVDSHLDECLASILVPSQAVIEVIAVDDASPDDCGKILEAWAARDPRLRVIHLAENGGPGRARNVGFAHAAGEYVWFVDADDLLTDDAIAAVADRIAQDRPDLLLIDYQDLFPDGRTAPSYGAALLRDAPAAPFTFAEHPQVIWLTMTSWSKVIRREFLAGLRLPFPAGIHEDVPLSCELLLSAARISALARVCYGYRRDRRGSFMATTSSLHAGIFAAYQQVFDSVAKRVAGGDATVTDSVTAAVFERAIWHYTAILDTGGFGIGAIRLGGGLVPRRARRSFFALMHEHFVRYRPGSYHRPPGARGVKYRLVERNAYWTYSALEPFNKLRVWLGRHLPGGR
jgi:CDP-glycerol glycerophosphotransferase